MVCNDSPVTCFAVDALFSQFSSYITRLRTETLAMLPLTQRSGPQSSHSTCDSITKQTYARTTDEMSPQICYASLPRLHSTAATPQTQTPSSRAYTLATSSAHNSPSPARDAPHPAATPPPPSSS